MGAVASGAGQGSAQPVAGVPRRWRVPWLSLDTDCWFPPRVVRDAAGRIPGCRYTELAGLGHGAPLLAAGQVNPLLVEFLG
jgi:pimeloyl-ACP methyl ester carboxylesterase